MPPSFPATPPYSMNCALRCSVVLVIALLACSALAGPNEGLPAVRHEKSRNADSIVGRMGSDTHQSVSHVAKHRTTALARGGVLSEGSSRRSSFEDSKSSTKREGAEAAGVNVVFTANFSANSNTSFAEALCPLLNETVDRVDITCTGGFCLLPHCMAERLLNASLLYVVGAALESFKDLPASLSLISIDSSSIAPPSTGAAAGSGLDTNGNIVWTDLDNFFPSLRAIDIKSSGLKGSLPSKIPVNWQTFKLHGNLLSGEIPTDIFDRVLPATRNGAFYFDVSENGLTGSIDQNLFDSLDVALTPADQHGNFDFNFAFNFLEGDFPNDLFRPFANRLLKRFSFDATSNSLTGNPTSLFPEDFLSSSPDHNPSFVLRLAANSMSGSLPDALFDFGYLHNFEFDISQNGFSGLLPNALFSSDWNLSSAGDSFIVNFASNSFIGTLPEHFFVSGLTTNGTFFRVDIDISSNNFISIPDALLYYYRLQPAKKSSTDVYINRLVAISANLLRFAASGIKITSLPGDILRHAVASPLFSFTLEMDRCKLLMDPFPATLLDPVLDKSGSGATILVNFSGSSITGSPPYQCWTDLDMSVTYDFTDTKLNDSIPSTWQDCKFERVELDHISTLTALLPPYTLRGMLYFSVAGSPVTGSMPFLNETRPGGEINFDLSNTQLDFCTTPPSSSASSFSGTCIIYDADVCHCVDRYPMCITNCAVAVPAPNDRIPAAPNIPISPISPSTSSTCPPNTRPSPQFTCINGTWTAPAVNTTTLTVPSGAGTIFVIGNLTSTTVVIQGVGSTINITGSVTNLTTITIELTPAEVEALSGSKTLHILINTNNGNGSTSSGIQLGQVNVNSRVTSGCKKVKAEKVVLNEGQTLGAYLSVDSSGCNRWWIILVSVICALVLLAIIAVALLAAFYRPFREKIRPYSARRNPSGIN